MSTNTIRQCRMYTKLDCMYVHKYCVVLIYNKAKYVDVLKIFFRNTVSVGAQIVLFSTKN